MIILKHELEGSILDIGGGGEGTIGRLYGTQVIAIDNRQEELDEAPGGFEKVLMDARSLDFPDEHFDHVTFFYSLMFMDADTHKQAVSEAARVLKKGGYLHIWDAEIVSAYPDPFVVNLDIQLPTELVHTTFGIIRNIKNQTVESVGKLCIKCGMSLCELHSENGLFHLVFNKTGS